MVSALDSRLSSPVSAPSRDHRIVFFGKIVCSHSATPLPDVKMGSGCGEVTLQWTVT